jgi:EAL domain-containing protein (putative c-di-GMP-specific phosphodiesterase class I)
MVALCDGLEVATIAERVETAEQADKLKSFGIKFGQGWLFGKPSDGIPTAPLRATPPRVGAMPMERLTRRSAYGGQRSQLRKASSGPAT